MVHIYHNNMLIVYIKTTSNQGRGLYANCDYSISDIILVEQAYVMVSNK